MKRKQVHDYTHLALDQRLIIQAGITNGSTKTDIARTIGKDATTVAKEIRLHRILQPRNTYQQGIKCALIDKCPNKPCRKKCERFVEAVCSRRDRSPGACNGCKKAHYCRLDRYLYDAVKADKAYRALLSQSREGVSLTIAERDSQVNRRLRTKLKKRRETFNVEGRRYKDFLQFCTENPETPVVEMDTLYNDQEGPYIQTLYLRKTALMLGFLHADRTNDSMSSTFNRLQDLLGDDLFFTLFPVLLTDRGTEFIKFKLFELDTSGKQRLSIFYCDPMQASQKPFIENNHNYVRDIIPNGYPINQLNQLDLNLAFSHINNTPRQSLGWRSPYETFCFFYGADVASRLSISYIDRDSVTLKPYLIFNKH